MELFRKEVTEALNERWLGPITFSTSSLQWALAVASFFLSASLVFLLCIGTYTRRERVTGEIVPTKGIVNIASVSNGVLSRLLVREGEEVKAGQPLAELSTESSSEKLGNTREAISAKLDEQRRQIQEDVVVNARTDEIKKRELQRRLQNLKNEEGQLENQVELQRQQVAAAQKLLKKIQPLTDKGYISAVQVEQQRSSALEAQTQEIALRREELALHRQVNEIETAIENLPNEAVVKRNELAHRLTEADAALLTNEAQRATVLRASQNGVVAVVLARTGASVIAGQSILTLMPSDAELQAQLLVPSRAIGFMRPGERVALRYSAFPYQKFGVQYGSVINVAGSTLLPIAVEAMTGREVKDQMYRVDVAIEHQTIAAGLATLKLRPGMELQADIMLERRRLIEWLFEPLFRHAD